ncbi:MAG: tetratricopeptide repeat protein, partial [Chloroflexota bacterium]
MNLSGGLNLPTVLSKLAGLLLPEAAQRFRAEATLARQTYDGNLADLKKAEAGRSIDIEMVAAGGSHISGSSIRVQGDEAGEDKLRQNYYGSLITAFYAEIIDLPQQQVALFFDTFERAQDNAPRPEMAAFWAVLDELHQANPQLRVIVGGREDLQNQSARDWRQHQPLEVFSLADSNLFLQGWSDNQISPALRQAIFDLAQGHPLLTELAAQVWREGQLAGKPLTLAELKEGLTHRSGKEWLYGRIINRLEELGDLRLSTAARYGPLLRVFTLRSLNAILPEEVGKLDDPAFEKFTGYAFIKQTEAGWEFHELMRATQRAYLDKKDDPEVEACHSRAAEFFRERAQATQSGEMARNALYHACFVDPAAVFDDWLEAAFNAQLSGKRGWWDELLLTLEAPAQWRRLTPEQQGQLIKNRGMWHVRHYSMDEALASYGQALALFRAVGSRLGEANTLQAIGDVQGFKKENDEALASYGQALALFRAVGSRLGEANTLQAIG